MPHIHFVTFATPAFLARQWLLNYSARWFGKVDRLHVWTKNRLAKDGFIDRHSVLFPNSKGFGWYAWKPYVILHALRDAADGDLVIYQDVGRRKPLVISHDLHVWDGYLTAQGIPCVAGVRIPAWGPNKYWTKRNVFGVMGLLDDLYHEQPQVQASWSVWRKCARSEAFVREWAALCERLDLVGGQLENGIGNEVPGFQEHRWDQSLLTLLCLRDRLPVLDPTERRSPGLDEKCVDSFGANPQTSIAFKVFDLLVRLYYLLEFLVKKVGLIRRKQVPIPQ